MLFFYETLGWWSGASEVRKVHFAEVREREKERERREKKKGGGKLGHMGVVEKGFA